MVQSIAFAPPRGPLQARFDGPHLTSDGSLSWLAEADMALGLCAALAAQIREWRHGPVRHALESLVRQRVLQIACGYEDQNDATTLRADPLLKLVCGRLPHEPDLASQPTLSRLEVLAAPLAAEAQRQRVQSGEKVRLLGEGAYQADSWGQARRVVVKAEALDKGLNLRFVVTTRADPPDDLYHWYTQRGEYPELCIKDLKDGCFADRLSCRRFWTLLCQGVGPGNTAPAGA